MKGTKKIELLEVNQHGLVCYIGVADPRDLVRLAKKEEMEEKDIAQRPITQKRCKDIANFVGKENGLLSTSIVIGTTKGNTHDNLKIKRDENGRPYVLFPVEPEDFEEMKDAFNVIDGQHRLFSFLETNKVIADGDPFELAFTLYIDTTVEQRRLIFTNTNEKQEKVASNLLMWLRAQLDLLEGKDKEYYPVVEKLNEKGVSPLSEKIIMGSEKVANGYKAKQLIKIFDKIGLNDMLPSCKNSDEKRDMTVKIVADYLRGWEKAVGVSFNDKKEVKAGAGAFTKISGIRFMIHMLPTFYKIASRDYAYWNDEYIKGIIEGLCASQEIEAKAIFATAKQQSNVTDYNPFSSESGTIKYAKIWSKNLDEYAGKDSKEYNPFAEHKSNTK